jgi:predicted glutamine amidotransferase
MCRLLGYCSRGEAALADLIGEEAFYNLTALSALHSDGWGMAWYSGGEPVFRKSPLRADEEPEFDKLARQPLSDLGLLHLRWATPGLGINEGNSHPFRYGPYVLAHNGAIHPQDRLGQLLPPDWERRLGGTTDSERYFLLIMSRLAAAGADAAGEDEGGNAAGEDEGGNAAGEDAAGGNAAGQDMVAAIAAATASIERRFSPNSLNAILLSPATLYAINWHDPAKVPDAQLRQRGYGHRPDEIATYFDLAYRASGDAMVVASSGWPQPGWTPLPNRHVLVADRATLDVQVLPLGDALPAASARARSPAAPRSPHSSSGRSSARCRGCSPGRPRHWAPLWTAPRTCRLRSCRRAGAR